MQTTKVNVHGAINMLGLSQNASKPGFSKRQLPRYTATPPCTPRPKKIKKLDWGNVNCIGLRSCYDEGKRCAETLFFDYHRQHKLNIRVVRIFNTYGPRMHPNDGRVVSNFIMQKALTGRDITVFGDGSQTRSFCFVRRLVIERG